MRLKIFSCHHLIPDQSISTDIFQTLVSGHRTDPSSQLWTDMDGVNIAEREKFCELRHQYYVWQNHLADYDYVGFEHYRRPFFLDPMPAEHLLRDYPGVADLRRRVAADPLLYELAVDTAGIQQFNTMRASLTAEDKARLLSWTSSYDVLFTFPIFYDVNENFLYDHSNAEHLWHIVTQAVRRDWLPNLPPHPTGLAMKWSAYLNMYVMRSELFSEYMDMLFSILLPLDREYPDAPPRVWGYVTERILGAFIANKMLQQPMLRWRCIPHLFQHSRP